MTPAMDISSDGLSRLMGREGVRLLAYPDTRGICTIGVGHTCAAGPPVPTWGMEITTDVAMAIFHRDLGPEIAMVNRVVKVPCSQQEFDAMVSIAFNIGVNGFAGSTIVHRLNAGDVDGAADAFLMWNEPPELLGRRQSERLQFLSGGMVPRLASPDAHNAPLYSTRWLQVSLNTLGVVSPPLDVDGVYGERTKAAVRKFQTSAGIFVDGLAGSQTNTVISAALAGK